MSQALRDKYEIIITSPTGAFVEKSVLGGPTELTIIFNHAKTVKVVVVGRSKTAAYRVQFPPKGKCD